MCNTTDTKDEIVMLTFRVDRNLEIQATVFFQHQLVHWVKDDIASESNLHSEITSLLIRVCLRMYGILESPENKKRYSVVT